MLQRLRWLCLTVFLFVIGCANAVHVVVPPSLANHEFPEPAAHVLQKFNNENEIDWLLYYYELALICLENGDRKGAEACLDEGILLINDVYSLTSEAKRARSSFYSESSKHFKGEPHERAFVFLLRGLLYMQEEDWGNARASFKAALIQDSFAEEEQYTSDWVSPHFLMSVCEYQLGNLYRAQKQLELAQETYASVSQADNTYRTSSTNTPVTWSHLENLHCLVVAALGQGPEKMRVGPYGEFLSYVDSSDHRASHSPVVESSIGDSWVMDSLHFQAHTRGGRYFDYIQGKKVFFKNSTLFLAESAQMAGLVTMSVAANDDTALIGAAILASGILLDVLSGLVRTSPDLRQLLPIPSEIIAYVFSSPESAQEFLTRSGWTVSENKENKKYRPGVSSDIEVVLVLPSMTGQHHGSGHYFYLAGE